MLAVAMVEVSVAIVEVAVVVMEVAVAAMDAAEQRLYYLVLILFPPNCLVDAVISSFSKLLPLNLVLPGEVPMLLLCNLV
jgi:hypothetical protein